MSRLFYYVDSAGNILSKYEDGRVTLKLKAETKERRLGIIQDDCFYVSRGEKHVFWQNKSFGFNFFVLQKSRFKYVVIEYEGKIYKVPKTTILEYGRVMNFKKSDFELQIFFAISLIKNYLAN